MEWIQWVAIYGVLWPLLYAVGILYVVFSFIFSGKTKSLLTTEVLRDPNRADIPVDVAPRGRAYSDSSSEVFVSRVESLQRENIERAVQSFPDSQEGKSIHIIGIIPDKMVSSYETDQSVRKS
jgi:hypothetical protein